MNLFTFPKPLCAYAYRYEGERNILKDPAGTVVTNPQTDKFFECMQSAALCYNWAGDSVTAIGPSNWRYELQISSIRRDFEGYALN